VAPPSAPRVRLARLPVPCLEALVAGDLDRASREAGIPLTPYFVDERWLWLIRLAQLETRPAEAPWIARAALDAETGEAVGHVGFHGPPDERGMVEVAYSVDPVHRRQGYARAMLAGALDWAASEPGVRVVRASVSPDNAASLATLRPIGFVHVGEQWDADDGRELLFERAPR
jgi:ribosomal-protein-alanine N-acetyltransferase